MESGPIDVIALQEVDRSQDRTAGVDQARLVAETIGARHWRFVPSVRGTPGIASEGAAWVPATDADDLPADECEPETATESGPRYGIALISRYPVRGWRVMRYPPAPVSMPLLAPTEGRPKAIRVPDEPRSAVAGIVELPYADVTIATAHLSFVPGVNTKQLNGLRAFVAGMPRPMILMGDFNTPGGIPGLVTGWDQVARDAHLPGDEAARAVRPHHGRRLDRRGPRARSCLRPGRPVARQRPLRPDRGLPRAVGPPFRVPRRPHDSRSSVHGLSVPGPRPSAVPHPSSPTTTSSPGSPGQQRPDRRRIRQVPGTQDRARSDEGERRPDGLGRHAGQVRPRQPVDGQLQRVGLVVR